MLERTIQSFSLDNNNVQSVYFGDITALIRPAEHYSHFQAGMTMLCDTNRNKVPVELTSPQETTVGALDAKTMIASGILQSNIKPRLTALDLETADGADLARKTLLNQINHHDVVGSNKPIGMKGKIRVFEWQPLAITASLCEARSDFASILNTFIEPLGVNSRATPRFEMSYHPTSIHPSLDPEQDDHQLDITISMRNGLSSRHAQQVLEKRFRALFPPEAGLRITSTPSENGQMRFHINGCLETIVGALDTANLCVQSGEDPCAYSDRTHVNDLSERRAGHIFSGRGA